MIIMGGYLKGKAVFFGVMGIVFLVLAFTMSSITRTTFLIIGISWLVAAGFSFWMAKAQDNQNQNQQQPGGWAR
jgi:type IV secretory pathway TraG/TraD family ATPase VirD4